MRRTIALLTLLSILLLSGKATAVTDWKARLKKEYSSLDSRVKNAKRFYRDYGRLVNRYKGGMPAGFMAAIAQWESNGKMSSAGDVGLGEIGIYQITASAPKHFGVDPDVRRKAHGNVFLAGLEYNANANRLVHDFPNLVAAGTKDQWYLARLSFAIGYGGTTKLIKLSGRRYGMIWDDIVKYVDRTGGIPLGSQSAAKVWYRVHAVDVQWKVGERVADMTYSQPVRVPAYRRYKIPARYGFMVASVLRDGIVVASLGLGLWLLE